MFIEIELRWEWIKNEELLEWKLVCTGTELQFFFPCINFNYSCNSTSNILLKCTCKW